MTDEDPKQIEYGKILASVLIGIIIGSLAAGVYVHYVWFMRITTLNNLYAQDGTISESEVCKMLLNDEHAFYYEGCCRYSSDAKERIPENVMEVCLWISP